MTMKRFAGVVPKILRFWPGLAIAVMLAGCSDPFAKQTEIVIVPPPMRWDQHPEALVWTRSTMNAVSTKDEVLADRIPADIETWCPGYATASMDDRRAFWVGMLSTVAKYESSWNPAASGGGGRWIGLMQIAPKSAVNYGCAATSVVALKDGTANLQCAVEIASTQVGKDGLVAGNGTRGIGRDWAPLRDAAKRAEMAAWTKAQPYCTAG